MKKWLSILVSIGIIAAIYSSINFSEVFNLLYSSNKTYVTLAICMIPFVIGLSAFRLQILVSNFMTLNFFVATKLVCSANTLNSILPSKLGDVAKAYYFQQNRLLKGNTAVSLMIFEKLFDMLAILIILFLAILVRSDSGNLKVILIAQLIAVFVFVGLVVLNRRIHHLYYALSKKIFPVFIRKIIRGVAHNFLKFQRYYRRSRSQLLVLFGVSVGVSFFHFLQLYLLFKSIYAPLEFWVHLSLVPLSIIAGLFPLTLSGIGSRDIVLIALFASITGADVAAGFGILATLRVFLLGLPGILFVTRIFQSQQR